MDSRWRASRVGTLVENSRFAALFRCRSHMHRQSMAPPKTSTVRFPTLDLVNKLLGSQTTVWLPQRIDGSLDCCFL